MEDTNKTQENALVWVQLMDYFTRTAKYMRHIYKDKNQTNTPITWADLDTLNERIRKDLDIIYAGTTNVPDDAPNKNENKTRKNMNLAINESQ